jgi:hypothetical protein
MRGAGTRGVLLISLAVLSVVGCQRRQYLPFLHQSYRGTYAIEDDEFDGLQFYVSRDILVKDSDSALTGIERVVILRTGTRGVVTSATPDTLIVSFEKGNPGVPFVTDPGRSEDRYWFATRLEGESGYHKIKDLPEKVYLLEGRAYPVVYGADAYLLVDGKDMTKLIERRPHLSGVSRPRRSKHP